jgi:predicted XRE-type DNA-binding protein
MTDKTKVNLSSSNVFEDLGLADSSELLIKAELARQITEIMVIRNFTLGDAAKSLNVDSATIARLLDGKLSEFPRDHLLNFLNILGKMQSNRSPAISTAQGKPK